ncbi:MAG: hypothetical protein SFX73_32140 [Kofleriaceae bacterium]|nr:hypothetical protein [Kofleriaceae bacterium]
MANVEGGGRRASPAWIVSIAFVIAIAVTVVLIATAERLPALPLTLQVEGDRVVDATGAEVGAIRVPGSSTTFALKPVDLIEEPDVVDSWEALDEFYARQAILWHHLQGEDLEVQIAGAWRTIAVERRGITGLPLAFYTLLAAALVAWIVGFLTFAFSDRGRAARIYVFSAVAFAVAVWPAALYSTRPLALDPETFRWLSTIDHVGALYFAGGVIGILAVYPVPLVRSLWWLWAFAGVAGVLGHLQVGEMWLSGFYTSNLIEFLMFLGFALWQWRAARSQPLQRAALGWMLLSMFVGVIFFLSLITLPVLLGVGPTITQATGLVSIVFMYAGISLGVLRFRLFELDRWWFRTWTWILSGMAVIAVDLVLTRLFDVTQNAALVVALIVVGWVYFPLRQRLFERFTRTGVTAAFDARELIAAISMQDLRSRFRAALAASFSPLEIVEIDEPFEAPRLAGDGALLEVPSPTGDRALRCRLRDHGTRLFSRDDVARAAELVALAGSVRGALTAREDGQVAERARIRRDLHDDLGASIIRIAHQAADENAAHLAKAAMRDLRDVLAALHDEPTLCVDLLEDLEADLRGRAQAHDRELAWTVEGTTDHVLSARGCANLTRVLRESMTNALKHGTGTIRYAFVIDARELRATITNAMTVTTALEPGLGLGNIRARLTELGGQVSYAGEDGVFRVEISLPWTKDT